MTDLPPPPPPPGDGGGPPVAPGPPDPEAQPPSPPTGADVPTPPVPPVASPRPEVPDPHALGAAVARLGNASRKGASVALGIASVSLEAGEQVELVIQGQIQDSPGVAVLTDRRVVLVNEAAWVPLVETLAIDRSLRIEGEADGRAATVTITTPTGVWQVAGSRDVDLTKGFAARLRARAAGA